MLVEHGTVSRYGKGCRCAPCTAANTAKAREARARRKGKQPPTHGYSAYNNWNCRCEVCVVGHGAQWKDQQQRAQGTCPPEHGLTGYKYYGCRCEVCTRASTRRANAFEKKINDISIDRARRRKQEWTGPELELAAREDLSPQQVAEALGRTYCAVRAIRRRLKIDPRLISLAGIRTSLDD